VQAVLKTQLPEQDHESLRHSVHLLLTNGDPGDPEATQNWPRYAELLPHANASNAVICQSPWVIQLVTNLVRYLINSGDFYGARDYAKQALDVWRSTLGQNATESLNMARLYGVSLWRMGNMDEARELNQDTYRRLRESVEEDDESLLRMGDTLSGDLRGQGLFNRELENSRDVYERAVRILGEDDPETLRFANNLASSYRLVGDYFKAREMDQENLQRRIYKLGENHRFTLGSQS